MLNVVWEDAPGLKHDTITEDTITAGNSIFCRALRFCPRALHVAVAHALASVSTSLDWHGCVSLSTQGCTLAIRWLQALLARDENALRSTSPGCAKLIVCAGCSVTS